MKTLTVLFLALLLAGCSTTETTISVFDEKGNIVEVTTTTERDIFDKVTESTRGKSVIMYTDGWCAYVSCSMITEDDPSPHVKMFAGKHSKGYISILPEQQNLKYFADIIKATKSSLTVNAEGISDDK